ncbi:GDYXXLXY domain-containing protein [Pelotomaculum propionicicum]|uniref:GDYXXLXY domain-containing protein n=1 Tax=Pelotomaculum propionicicum TaxID=258475 RepID=UPI003B7FA0DF
MKRSYKIGVIVILQVLFLFGMIGVRYYTLASGTPVLLKAAPVDPWDVFRGEYVMLEYDITWIKGEGLDLDSSRQQDVYVVLEKGEKYWQAAGIYLDKPVLAGEQVLVKGDVDYYNELKGEYHVSYGIESYFVEEGTGTGLQQSKVFDAQVKVDRFGSAAIEKIIAP